jgi:hypothetical protein
MERKKTECLTEKQRAAVVAALSRCLESDDLRIVLRAASKLIFLEGENQKAERAETQVTSSDKTQGK